jgi:hypothetical protein
MSAGSRTAIPARDTGGAQRMNAFSTAVFTYASPLKYFITR